MPNDTSFTRIWVNKLDFKVISTLTALPTNISSPCITHSKWAGVNLNLKSRHSNYFHTISYTPDTIAPPILAIDKYDFLGHAAFVLLKYDHEYIVDFIVHFWNCTSENKIHRLTDYTKLQYQSSNGLNMRSISPSSYAVFFVWSTIGRLNCISINNP